MIAVTLRIRFVARVNYIIDHIDYIVYMIYDYMYRGPIATGMHPWANLL